MRRHVLAAVEACYSLEGDLDAWITRVGAALVPLMARGLGVYGWLWRPGEWHPPKLPWGVEPELGRAMWAAMDSLTPDEGATVFFGPRTRSATERLGDGRGLDEHPQVGPTIAALGIRDFHALSMWDPSGLGILFATPCKNVVHTGPGDAERLERVAAHVLAGLRLRQTLQQIDAVLEPDGSLVHAEHEAKSQESRDALRRAVVTLEHARSSRGRRDPEEALAAWQALVEGRWSVVEHFESDGRRYLLARQNAPGHTPGTSLSGLEAHALLLRAVGTPYKLIAYELGLAVTTVHGLTSSGMRKLGIETDAQLVALFRAQALAALEKLRRGE